MRTLKRWPHSRALIIPATIPRIRYTSGTPARQRTAAARLAEREIRRIAAPEHHRIAVHAQCIQTRVARIRDIPIDAVRGANDLPAIGGPPLERTLLGGRIVDVAGRTIVRL